MGAVSKGGAAGRSMRLILVSVDFLCVFLAVVPSIGHQGAAALVMVDTQLGFGR